MTEYHRFKNIASLLKSVSRVVKSKQFKVEKSQIIIGKNDTGYYYYVSNYW